MGKAALTPDGQTIAYTGTLLAAAQMRYTPVDAEGHMAPALCMSVLVDDLGGAVLHLEQCFPPSASAQCQAAARRYRAGMRVTVVAPMHYLKINARFIEHIHVHKDAIPTNPPTTEQPHAHRYPHAV